MRIESRSTDNALIVSLLESRLDSYVAHEFRDAMDACIEQGHPRIVLDLSQLEFVDSSGLGAIVTAQKRLGTERDLILCGPSDAVLRLFKLARLDRIFQVVADEQEAMALLSR